MISTQFQNDLKACFPLFRHCYRLTSAFSPTWSLVQVLSHCHQLILEVQGGTKRCLNTVAHVGQQSSILLQNTLPKSHPKNQDAMEVILLAPSLTSIISVYDTFCKIHNFERKESKDLCIHYCIGIISITSKKLFTRKSLLR